jgi:carbamoyl-phosphate synthase large subunit
MMDVFNVLIFPGGTEIANEISLSLKHCKEVRIFSASFLAEDPIAFQTNNHFFLPPLTEKDFLSKLNALIEQEKIDYIFPAHDEAIIELALLRDKINSKIIAPSQQLCETLRYKSKTYQALEGVIRIPGIFLQPKDVIDFPVFIKPDRGQGSQGAHLIENKEQLYEVLQKVSTTQIMCEYLPGEEITVDCFSDRQAGLLYCQGRTRERVRSGISNRSRIYDDPTVLQIAEKIQISLQLYGPWFFQLKRDRLGEWVLLEIAPRIAGTMALNRVRGVNFALLAIYEELRKPLAILVNNSATCIERMLSNRYILNLDYKTVYIDLDDTVIIHNRINTQLVAFLYQCIDKQKTIILLTRHSDVSLAILDRYNLRQVFTEVYVLEATEQKSQYIKDADAIFIDDSFAELVDVKNKKNIPVFHPSMIECLIDHRLF